MTLDIAAFDSQPERVRRLFRDHYPVGEPVSDILESHSLAVGRLALELAAGSAEVDLEFLAEAAWLHDLGVRFTHAPGIGCFGSEPYLRHGVIGRRLCEERGLVAHGLVCERHVGTGFTQEEILQEGLPLPPREMLPLTVEEKLICYADQFFSKSRSGRLELEQVRARVARHGPAPLGRFEALQAEFGLPRVARASQSIRFSG